DDLITKGIVRVLTSLDTLLKEVGEKACLADTSLKDELPIHIACAFPGDDGFEMGRMECRYPPLRHGKIGYSAEAHLTIAPRLLCSPFDQFSVILGILEGEPSTAPL